jgi:hypothetical protein
MLRSLVPWGARDAGFSRDEYDAIGRHTPLGTIGDRGFKIESIRLVREIPE